MGRFPRRGQRGGAHRSGRRRRGPDGPTASTWRPTLALLDYETTKTNPVGSVHRLVVEALCDSFDITVFSAAFDNPRPDRVCWARVPAVRRPLLLLYVTFHAMVAARLAWERLVRRRPFDIVQSIESASFQGDVVHAQFCHRWFVDHANEESWPTGHRGVARKLYERAAAAVEPLTLGRASQIIVPSEGGRRAICESYPALAPKVRVVHNCAELGRMARPNTFDRQRQRDAMGVPRSSCLLAFVALGHFERKGLPYVLHALEQVGDDVALVVVGGSTQALAPYRRWVEERRMQDRVRFVGPSNDVRPYLWASDAFVLASSYEGFPLVALEAAAAGLPLISTLVNGIDEVLVDGEAGLVIERSATSVVTAIERFTALDAEARRRMGARAGELVEQFSPGRMLDGWRDVYEQALQVGASNATVRERPPR